MADKTEFSSGDIADIVTRQKPKIIGAQLKSKRSLARIVDRVRKENKPKKRVIPTHISEFDIQEHPELVYFPISEELIKEHLELNLAPPEPRKFLTHDDGKYFS